MKRIALLIALLIVVAGCDKTIHEVRLLAAPLAVSR
jgi:hypothetical protein